MYVRPFIESDKEDFLRLCSDFYSTGATNRGYNQGIALKTFEQVLSKHENLWGYIMIDKELNKSVGYTLVTSYWCNEDGGNVIVLDELYIEPIDCHKGYGKYFMDWIENEFKDKAVSITLEVVTTNYIAKGLYKKMGYADDGFEVMSKRLANKKTSN